MNNLEAPCIIPAKRIEAETTICQAVLRRMQTPSRTYAR
jgi:hypothetical protein